MTHRDGRSRPIVLAQPDREVAMNVVSFWARRVAVWIILAVFGYYAAIWIKQDRSIERWLAAPEQTRSNTR
jgi:hypothetical protein